NWLGLLPPRQSAGASAVHVISWYAGVISVVIFLAKRKQKWAVAAVSCVIVGYATAAASPLARAGGLVALDDRSPSSLCTRLAQQRSGVFRTETPGLVVLAVPRHRKLNDASVALREFALDSDLVLGAVGTADSVAIVGRERTASVIALPPLRSETLLQLAAAGTGELAQSYERMSLFAGKLPRAHRDWPPIYLSPQLVDSEYGSLLNITDQLLKSWSEHGEIEYVDFPYPKPQTFPFPTGLLKHAGTSMVTYNWNTKGVGYVDAADGYDVLAF